MNGILYSLLAGFVKQVTCCVFSAVMWHVLVYTPLYSTHPYIGLES